MARKSMKSRVPADVWAAIEAMRKGDDESHTTWLGSGEQGAVFAVDGNEDWVIKRWHDPSDKDYPGWRYSGDDWRAKDLAKDIARGLIEDVHLPRIIYARGRYVVMERLHDTVDWKTCDRLWNAHDFPARSLSKKWRPLRRAMRKLERNGYRVNDIVTDNVMVRKDGTIVLNDVAA